MNIREITRRQFDAYCYVRAPFIRHNWQEVAWYDAGDKKLLGAVVMDLTDEDFGYVILGRDKRKIFRAIDICTGFYATAEEATKELKQAFLAFDDDGKEFYEQGDEQKLPNEILIPKSSKEKLHPYFKYLVEEERFEAARNLIREIVYTYVDVDGNYIKSFQTTGFDARLWELYLYVYLHNAGFNIHREFHAPDFCVSYFGEQVTIEAVTVNANPGFDEPSGPVSLHDAHVLSNDYMPIKFGSALYSKLQKKYWTQEHVRGWPFILAIHDYHIPAGAGGPGSMTWSRSALCDYLYGYRMKVTILPDGKIQKHIIDTGNGVKPELEKIDTHQWKDKIIPSGFFTLPDAENISAVLFSGNATITTFNRMGKLAGLGGEGVKMIRTAALYDPDPYATTPQLKLLDVDDPSYEESWADSLIMYHNPRAKYPVNPDLFPDISHMFFDENESKLYGMMQPYSVLASVTLVSVTPKTLQ